jgi:hypothetical protein
MPTPQPDSTPDSKAPSLVPTPFVHPIGRCGERIESPHPAHERAERFVERWATLVLCRCGAAWREAA